MPEVRTIEVPERAAMGVAVEGERRRWPGNATPARPGLDRFGRRRAIEVFNRGGAAFRGDGAFGRALVARVAGPIEVAERGGHCGRDRLGGGAAGRRTAPVILRGSDGTGHGRRRDAIQPTRTRGFVESDGSSRSRPATWPRRRRLRRRWRTIPNLGLTLSGVTPFPVRRGRRPAAGRRRGSNIRSICSPPARSRCSWSCRRRSTIAATAACATPSRSTTSRRRSSTSTPARPTPTGTAPSPTIAGADHPPPHRRPRPPLVRLWMVDPGLVFQRLLVRGRLPPTYLGPPESARR